MMVTNKQRILWDDASGQLYSHLQYLEMHKLGQNFTLASNCLTVWSRLWLAVTWKHKGMTCRFPEESALVNVRAIHSSSLELETDFSYPSPKYIYIYIYACWTTLRFDLNNPTYIKLPQIISNVIHWVTSSAICFWMGNPMGPETWP